MVYFYYTPEKLSTGGSGRANAQPGSWGFSTPQHQRPTCDADFHLGEREVKDSVVQELFGEQANRKANATRVVLPNGG